MPVEQSKVMTALNAKLAGKNVSQKTKDAYVARWANKIATDEEIDAFVDDRWEEVWDAQTTSDARVNALKNPPKPDPANPKSGEAKDAPTDEDDTKALLKKALERLDKIEQARNAETAEATFRKMDALKGIPEAWIKRALPGLTAENMETIATELRTDFDAFAAENQLQKFGNDNPPGTGGGATGGHGGGKGKVDADIVAFAKQKAAEATKTSS